MTLRHGAPPHLTYLHRRERGGGNSSPVLALKHQSAHHTTLSSVAASSFQSTSNHGWLAIVPALARSRISRASIGSKNEESVSASSGSNKYFSRMTRLRGHGLRCLI